MKKTWSSAWVASKQPRKQRKYRYQAPLHIKNKFLQVHLIKALREKHGQRALRARVGDTIRVMRGDYAGKEGKVNKISLVHCLLYVDGIERIKKDGTKLFVPLKPSAVMLTSVVTSDKRRFTEQTIKKKEQVKDQKEIKPAQHK